MTEQERIDSIEAFTKMFYEQESIKGSKTWDKLSRNEIEYLRDSTINLLRSICNAGLMKGRWLYENVIHGDWDNTSDNERKVCIDASITMQEVLRSERD